MILIKNYNLATAFILISAVSFCEKNIGVDVAIENAVIFPCCEIYNENAALKQCMSNKITEFIAENFDTKLATTLSLKDTPPIT